METVKINPGQIVGVVKPMHAVNNGPVFGRKTQKRSNFETFQEARIPYSRNHDASFCPTYGGENIVDVHAIFKNFDADPYDPASYDFTLTDLFLENILAAGTKIYYRLGSKIEHCIKKYGTQVPKDFHKWAVICEHIIRHYNEGWADGFFWNIEYWEIWNEPNLDRDDAENKRNWNGTAQQFYELYDVASRHLKKCFPHLKIGGIGSALTGYTYEWLEKFFQYLTRTEEPAPMDFFAWHIYIVEPWQMVEHSENYRKLLDKYGYTQTESILDEWNYVENWGDGFIDSIRAIIGVKGAAVTMATMIAAQNSTIDMLMYYDARPGSTFNGMFDFYTLEKLPGYYPFYAFASLYDKKNQVSAESTDDKIYAMAAKDDHGDVSAIVCHYTNERNTAPKQVKIECDFLTDKKVRYILMDENHIFKEITPEDNTVQLLPNSFLFITQDDMDDFLARDGRQQTAGVYKKNIYENI